MTESLLTSYVGLFEAELDGTTPIDSVEVPLIQRDYAQGRQSPAVTAIRESFLSVLRSAVAGEEPVGLDFVYGEVSDGTLRPLDGQQRLTALFLLHWYLAARTGRIDEPSSWGAFSYATRPSARLFCERLASCMLPADASPPSVWITDQPWYLYTWRHDPTVQSMLVVLDTLDRLLVDDDLEAAWQRLVDPDAPAISFHLLPIEDMGSAEDLYIKMNSRGRPLTEFENFKARLEKALDGSPRSGEFAEKVDGPWSDLLWPMHGGDNLIDDEFVRYIRFVIELCEWRNNDITSRHETLIRRAVRVFGTGQPGSEDNLDFLFHAFDTWADEDDIPGFFHDLFAVQYEAAADGEPKVVLFGQDVNADLLEACCRDFGNEQRFGNSRKLLLYAVLIHRVLGTDDIHARLRSLRNLLEASEDEMRAGRMPRIVYDVHRVIIDGDLAGVEALNQVQRGDELEKRAFLDEHAELRSVVCALEDNPLLRGSLVAFDLDAARIGQRSEALDRALSTPETVQAFTGALVATGEYHRTIKASLKFGAPERSSRWRDLLTGASRADMESTRSVLATVLDAIATAGDDVPAALEAIASEFIQHADVQGRYGWRYYLAKYPTMRIGRSGIYRTPDATMGYSICMLNREQMNSNYRDPFLLAVVRQAGVEASVVDGEDGPWFTGAATNERWLRTRASDVQMRCVDKGFQIKPPPEDEHRVLFDEVRAGRDDIIETPGGDYLLVVPQVEVNAVRVDTADRVVLGSDLLSALVDAGL